MRFAYTILFVPDVRRTLEFYARAFGLTTRFCAEDGTYAELETGPVALAFAQEDFAERGRGLPARPTRPGEAPPAFEVALVTEDVAGAYDRAVAAGAVAVAAPAEKPWGQTVAYVRDGDGALVELATPMG